MLIKTKLIIAPLKSCMLYRKGLVQRLCAAEGYPIILISGPAGSGKTSLACQWIGRGQHRIAWYSLDEEDNEPDLFFRYLLTSLAQSDAGLHKALTPMLQNHRGLAAEEVIPHLITALSALRRDIYIVLDDFHRITSGQIHDALARIIEYIPARMHLVFLSRYSLPARIDAVTLKKEKLLISASDLKFTEGETAALYKEVFPLSLSADQIQALNRHVEGWAAGLQLIGLSAQSQGHLLNLSDILNQAHDQVANYLIHDILRMQPEEIRNFILTTAPLDRFNTELCAEVTGMSDARDIIDHLEQMNLFLIPLDTRHEYYRYHHMFSEVVRRQAAIADPDAIPTTLRKAASWWARHQHLEDALRSAFGSGDLEFAADLMEDHVLSYVGTFDLAAGLRWISKLPESTLNQRPLLRLFQCSFLALLMELSELKEIIAALEKDGETDLSRYSGDKLAFGRDLIAFLKCLLQILYAGETASVEQLQVLRNKIHPQNQLLAGYIDTQIVSNLILKGDLSLAESFLDRLSKTAVPRPDQQMRKRIYHAHARALIAKHRGRLHLAEAIIRQVLQFFSRRGCDHISMAFLLHRQLGNIYYLQNRLTEARQCATAAVKHCESFGLIDEIMTGNELWLQLHLAAGENAQALQCIRNIQSHSIRFGMPRIADSAEACAARLAIAQGNLTAAGLWSQRRNLQPDEPFSLLYAMECLTQARLFYARGQYPDAVHLLGILRNRCVERTLGELVLQINILQSAAFHALNRRETAVPLLMEALAFSEIEGYIRPFVNDAKLIAPVLKSIAEETPRDPAHPHLEKILTACDIASGGPDAPHRVNTSILEALTQRETEILMLVAKGFPNKEIARKACIAITTVKSHVSNILIKLNVKNRTQAILKAKEMKVLEME